MACSLHDHELITSVLKPNDDTTYIDSLYRFGFTWKDVFTNATLFRLPRIRLRTKSSNLDWIDDYDSIAVHVEFCDWIADRYHCTSPSTNSLILADWDACVGLYRWNSAFVTHLGTGEDGYNGILGFDSTDEPIDWFPTWMTQRQAWQMWTFLNTSLRSNTIVVECRYVAPPERGQPE